MHNRYKKTHKYISNSTFANYAHLIKYSGAIDQPFSKLETRSDKGGANFGAQTTH